VLDLRQLVELEMGVVSKPVEVYGCRELDVLRRSAVEVKHSLL